MAAGRKSKYSAAIADEICDKIATSTKGLAHIVKKMGVSPSMAYRWLDENKEFRDKYARAREDQANLIADQIITIADSRANDATPFVGGNFIQRDRLRVDARKWMASKLSPKKYGDKIDVTTDGEKINDKPTTIVLSNGTTISL